MLLSSRQWRERQAGQTVFLLLAAWRAGQGLGNMPSSYMYILSISLLKNGYLYERTGTLKRKAVEMSLPATLLLPNSALKSSKLPGKPGMPVKSMPGHACHACPLGKIMKNILSINLPILF